MQKAVALGHVEQLADLTVEVDEVGEEGFAEEVHAPSEAGRFEGGFGTGDSRQVAPNYEPRDGVSAPTVMAMRRSWPWLHRGYCPPARSTLEMQPLISDAVIDFTRSVDHNKRIAYWGLG